MTISGSYAAKNLYRPLTETDDLDETLAWREERRVTRNLTLRYDRMMLLLDRVQQGDLESGPQIVIRSTSSSVISSPVRS